MAEDKARPGEFDLIARYLRPLADDPAALNLTDDAAAFTPPPGADLVLTKDMVAAGIHFFPDDPPASIARKALRVNLSDLAAKGARPVGYLLGLALPADWTTDWMADFAAGLAADQQAFGITLLGGDTVKAPGGLTLSITAIGAVPSGMMVRRAGARVGDVLIVSGTIGDAALGLRLRLGTIDGALAGEGAAHLLDRYLHPQPRTVLADAVLRHASAALDISDGLVGDLGHMLKASGVGARIEAARLPLSAGARALVAAEPSALASVLSGGDDYEILASVPRDHVEAYRLAADAAGIAVTAIGEILAGAGPALVVGSDGAAIRLERASHDHF
ncbi:MAG TPA: thiamine-phosphate kinase [Kaistia sp.]|nr:thiamine-phosphate kinase [Kaistia sp.]